jgi:hypothetical protein
LCSGSGAGKRSIRRKSENLPRSCVPCTHRCKRGGNGKFDRRGLVLIDCRTGALGGRLPVSTPALCPPLAVQDRFLVCCCLPPLLWRDSLAGRSFVTGAAGDPGLGGGNGDLGFGAFPDGIFALSEVAFLVVPAIAGLHSSLVFNRRGNGRIPSLGGLRVIHPRLFHLRRKEFSGTLTPRSL